MSKATADQSDGKGPVHSMGIPTALVGEQEGLTAVETVDQERLIKTWVAWLTSEEARGEISEATLTAYRMNIGYWGKFLTSTARLARPTPKTVGEYAAEIGEDHAPATVNAYLCAVKSFYRWCEANDLYSSIGRSVRVRAERRDGPLPALTHEEVVRLIAGIPETTLHSLRDRALISLIYATAMRTISIVRLNIDDVDLATNSLRHRGKGRRSKDTIAQFAASVGALLARYLDERHREDRRRKAKREGKIEPLKKRRRKVKKEIPGIPLFIALDRSAWGDRLTAKSIRAIVLKYMELAGHARRDNGKLVNPGVFAAHSLRRSAAVTTADAGGIELAQGLLGHASADTTKKAYARVKLHRDLQKNANRLDPLS